MQRASSCRSWCPTDRRRAVPLCTAVLPDGKVFETWLFQNNWGISSAPFGVVYRNSYSQYSNFPDQPILDVAAGPDGRLWCDAAAGDTCRQLAAPLCTQKAPTVSSRRFIGGTGMYERTGSGYTRLPGGLQSPLAIAANSQGPTCAVDQLLLSSAWC